MELERLSSEVRPRQSWEAIDLGFRQVQAWWWPVQRAWLMTALPVFIVLNALLWRYPDWAMLLFWWLKPLFERAPLEVLAQAQFGHVPSLGELRRRAASLSLRQALPALTLRRLSLSRSFKTPVMLLEGLSGTARRQRLAVLARGADRSGAQWLTAACAHIEVITYSAGMALVIALTPQTSGIDWLGQFAQPQNGLMHLSNVVAFLAIALVAPFYVGGGFALYLNRRTELEGWDIELAFRRLKRRLSAGLVSALVLTLSLGLGGWSHQARAETPALKAQNDAGPPPAADPEEDGRSQRARELQAKLDQAFPPDADQLQARQDAQAVMAGPAFHQMESEGHWRLKSHLDWPKKTAQQKNRWGFLDWLGSAGGALAGLVKVLLWTAVLLLGLWLALRLPAVARHLPRWTSRRQQTTPPPNAVAGLDIRPESLPQDVAGTALALLEAGDRRGALGLLYRAGLAALVHRFGLALRASHTEGEVLGQLTGNRLPDPAERYFRELTLAWQCLAYAHREPEPVRLSELCRQWREHFGEVAA